jgi:spermidine synthase
MTQRPTTIELPEVTVSESEGVRYLHLGTPWIQGAMRIARPLAIELEYVQRMMAWMLWRPSAELGQGHAVQLGLGAAAITRFTHGALKMRTTAVELNPDVIAACRHAFRLPQTGPSFAMVQADAMHWLQHDRAARDIAVLQVDLYDHEAAAPVLDDAAFYRACFESLAFDGGLMTVNLFGRHASFAESAARIAAVFGLDQCWSLRPTREGNTVLVAARNAVVPERDELLRRADSIEARFGLPARKWLRMVRPLDPSLLRSA